MEFIRNFILLLLFMFSVSVLTVFGVMATTPLIKGIYSLNVFSGLFIDISVLSLTAVLLIIRATSLLGKHDYLNILLIIGQDVFKILIVSCITYVKLKV